MRHFQKFQRGIRKSIARRHRKRLEARRQRIATTEHLEDRRLLARVGGDVEIDRPAPVDVVDLVRDSDPIWRDTTTSLLGDTSASKSGSLRKVGTDLAFLFHEHDAHWKSRPQTPVPRADDFTPANKTFRISRDRVVVDVVGYGDDTELAKQLDEIGMDVIASYNQIVSGFVPIGYLDTLAELRDVRFVKPFVAHTAVGTADTQGDVAQLSLDLRDDFGLAGSGVTVGVLSDSYDNLLGAASDVTNGDLPGNDNPNGFTDQVTVLSDMATGGTDEGRAMLQVIHDIAPAAKLAFATATQGQAAFAQSITDLYENAGANVIVDDVQYYAEPFFQDGIIAQAIDSAFANGVAYFSAAGNNGSSSYESNYQLGGTYSAAAFGSVSGAPAFLGGDAHDFDPGSGVDDLQGFTLQPGGAMTLSLQWEQPFASVSGGGGASTDVDVYVLNDSTPKQVVAASIDSNVGSDPVELLHFQNTTSSTANYHLMIIKYNGTNDPDPGRIKYVDFSNGANAMENVEHSAGGSTIVGHANASGAAAVGAAFWLDTPQYGTSQPIVASYSSVGGTDILLDVNGDPTSQPRNKPDFVAPTGGNTSFFGTDVLDDADTLPNFSGTSGAAAHAAGMAALLLESSPTATPLALYDSLRGTADDMGAANFDTLTGHGLIRGIQARNNLLEATDGATSSLDATTFDTGQVTLTTTGLGTYFGDELIPVDTTLTYELRGAATSGTPYNVNNEQYFGFASYDSNQDLIEPQHVRLYEDSIHTTLKDPLTFGATEIVLNDSIDGTNDGWYTGTKDRWRWFAWYPTNEPQYPAYVYTQHVWDPADGAWDETGINGNVITLTEPWPFAGTIPANTPVGNARTGAKYNYPSKLIADPVDNQWAEFSDMVSGIDDSAHASFRPGTAYVKPVLLTNQHGGGSNEITWTNVEFARANPSRFQSGDTADVHVNLVEHTPGAGVTYDWTQTSGPSVTLTGDQTPSAALTVPTQLVDYTLGFQVEISEGSSSETEYVVLHVDGDGGSIYAPEALLDVTEFAGADTITDTQTSDYFGDVYIPVDVTQEYRLKGEARSGDDNGNTYFVANEQFFGFESYDVDMNRIEAEHVRIHTGSTLTTLKETLDDGDPIIELNSAVGWYNGPTDDWRWIAFYGYQDSFGYTYPDYTYTRNVAAPSAGVWAEGSVNETTGIITLREPWSGGTIPKDTAVANTRSGRPNNYPEVLADPVPDQWTNYNKVIKGVDGSKNTSFRPGTAFIRPVINTNDHGAGNNEINWRNVEFVHKTEGDAFRAGPVVLRIDEVEFSGGTVTYQWHQVSGPSVGAIEGGNTQVARINAPDRLLDYTIGMDVDISDGATTATKHIDIDVEAAADYDAELGPATYSPAGTVPLGQTVDLSVNPVTFTGPHTYSWVQTTGPAVALVDADQPTASFQVPDIATGELTFQVTVSDGAVEIVKDVVVDVATSTADVAFRLEATDKRGNVLPSPSIGVGEDFVLKVYATDTGTMTHGVFAAYLDVWFDEELFYVHGNPTIASDYDLGSNFDVSMPGLIDETGGSSDDLTSYGSGERLVFSAVMVAKQSGTATFRADPADLVPPHEVVVYGSDLLVPETDIDYGDPLVVEVSDTHAYTTAGYCGNFQVSIDNPTITEGGASDTATVTISSTARCTVHVDVHDEIAGQDAYQGKGYTTLNITPSWQQLQNLWLDNDSVTFDIQAVSDPDSLDESISVRAQPLGDAWFEHTEVPSTPPDPTQTAHLTIADATSATCDPLIGGTSTGFSDVLEGTQRVVTVNAPGTSCGEMTVNWQATGGSPVEGTDFQAFKNGTLITTWPTVFNDGQQLTFKAYGGGETGDKVSFTATVGANTADHEMRIIDVPACSYTVSTSSASVNEYEADIWTDVDLTVTGSTSCDSDVPLSWQTTGDGAVLGEDFDVLAADGVDYTNGAALSLVDDGSGGWIGTIKVRVYADSIDEANTSTVTFNVTGDSANFDIRDDDGDSGHLEVVAFDPTAEEPHSFYHCGGGSDGSVRIQPSGSTWAQVSSQTLVIKLGGAATYGEDYTLQSPQTGLVMLPTGYIGVDVSSASSDIFLNITPLKDEFEPDSESITFELLTEAVNQVAATVTITDTNEDVTISATDPDAAEENQAVGQFSLTTTTSDDLCADVRLIIDTNVVDSADPNNDYTVRRVDVTPAVELSLFQLAGEFGFYQTPVMSATNISAVLIEIVPVDDGVFESTEFVSGRLQAQSRETGDWIWPTDWATVTIEDGTAAAMEPASIQIDLEPDVYNGCELCEPAVAAEGVFVDLQSGSPIVPIVPGLVNFLGQGTHGTQPIVRAEFQKPENDDWPASVTVNVDVDNWIDGDGPIAPGLPNPSPTFSLDTSNYTDAAVAIGIPVDVDGLPTGSYRFTVRGSATGHAWAATTSHFVINRWDTYDVAPGLVFPFLKRAIVTKSYEEGASPHPDGVAIIRGDNSVSWYKDDTTSYVTPPETTTTLTESLDGKRYILTDRFGNVDEFAKVSDGGYEPGEHIKHLDRNGNETVFTYNTNRQLATMVDPLKRDTAFGYDPQANSITLTITDFSDRVTTVSYDTSVTSQPEIDVQFPDPDVDDIENPSNPYDSGSQPTTKFEFDDQNQLTKVTRSAAGGPGSVDHVVVLNYDTQRRVASVSRADEAMESPPILWTLVKHRQAEQLPNPTTQTWTAVNGASPTLIAAFENKSEVTDRRGNSTSFALDHRGRIVAVTDAHGQTFDYERNVEYVGGDLVSDQGEILFAKSPDPDDFTARTDVEPGLRIDHSTLQRQINGFVYDSLLNVTLQTLPQLASDPAPLTLSWPDGFDLAQPREYVNEFGTLTEYSLSATGNGNIDGITVYSPTVAPNHGPRDATWQNPVSRLDVDRSGGDPDANDAAVIFADAGNVGFGAIDPNRAAGSPLVDTNGDGFFSPIDTANVTNYLDQNLPSSGSGQNQAYTAPPNQPLTFTYTPDVDTDLLPNGLLLTQKILTGRSEDLETKYEYYDGTDGAAQEIEDARFGLVKQITYAFGTPLAATVKYEYDENGNLRKFTDELDRETQFLFDNLDRLAKVISPDPDGVGAGQPLVTEYYYDAFGNVARVTQRNLNPAFDADENPATAPTSVSTEHTACYYYDEVNRLQWQIDPHPSSDTDGTSCEITGSLPADWTAAQNVTQWTGRPITYFGDYDANDNLLSATDPEDRTTTFAYDDLNRLNKIVEPAPDTTGNEASLATGHGEVLEGGGPVTTFIYDNLGNLWSTTDSLGQTTLFVYDAWNRQVEILEPEPASGAGVPKTIYEYTDLGFGWVYRVTDAKGRVTETQLDFVDRPLYTSQPAVDGEAPLTWYEYYSDNLVRFVTDPENNKTEYDYDDRARLSTIKQPAVIVDPGPPTVVWDNPITSFSYDAANQLTSVTDPLLRTTTYRYDQLGRIDLVTPPDPENDPNIGEDSPTVAYAYDSVGNLVEVTDGEGQITSYQFDHLFRNTKVLDGNGDATTFAYDLVDNLTSLTDAVNNTTTWTYDVLDRPYREKNQTDTNGMTDGRRFLYDAVGNLRQLTDRNGRVSTYGYDDLYRLTQEAWDSADSRTFTFQYDLVDNLLSATDSRAEAADYTFVYDDLDRATLETQVLGGLSEPVILAHDYDLVGNRLSLVTTLGDLSQSGTDDFFNTYQYDALYRMLSVTQSGQGGNAVAPKHVAFEYDIASQLTDVWRYSDTTADAQDLEAHSLYAYDWVGRVTSITHSRQEVVAAWDGTTWSADPASQTQIAAYFLNYDAANRIEEFSSWRDQIKATYTYDLRNQLTAATYAPQIGSPFDPPDESYGFDGNGNRNSANGATYDTLADNRVESDGPNDYVYDGEGNRTRVTEPGGAYTEYVWDHRNRLVSVISKTVGGVITQQVHYEYDIFDRRIGKRIGTGGEATTWVYDGPDVVLEFTDADGDGSASVPELSHRYLHGPLVDMILADEQVSDPPQAGAVHWPLTDHLGSVRDVIDNNGNVVNHVVYDAFGNKLAGGTSETVDFLYGFTGREWDEESQLQYNRARWYDPAVGSWISEDPIGFAARDANLYRYVGNAPVLLNDPTGLQESTPAPSVSAGACVTDPALASSTPIPRTDRTGKLHGDGRKDPKGDLPRQVPSDWGAKEIKEAIDEVEHSLRTRYLEEIQKGVEKKHRWRIEREFEWLQKLRDAVRLEAWRLEPNQVVGATSVGIGAWLMYVGAGGTGILLADDVTVVGAVDDVGILVTGSIFVVGGIIYAFEGPSATFPRSFFANSLQANSPVGSTMLVTPPSYPPRVHEAGLDSE